MAEWNHDAGCGALIISVFTLLGNFFVNFISFILKCCSFVTQMGKSEITKDKILNSAAEIFLKEGFSGATMRQVSDAAGVNKGLLHYYFKTKENLFVEVFRRTVGSFYLDVQGMLQDEQMSTDDKIGSLVDRYFDMLSSNPKLPVFLVSEIHKNPALVAEFQVQSFIFSTLTSMSSLGIDQKEAFQILLSIISLSIFPFMMSPLIHHFAANMEQPPAELVQSRKKHIKKLIINYIKE
ncbi:MAG TPA: hypothetical protein DDX92_06130 [Flavobacteriales bacterium]|jgi:TetR/AcrR family transcriptional regulator|nr:hypothetical protein [Flavobacteriales bacterium]